MKKRLILIACAFVSVLFAKEEIVLAENGKAALQIVIGESASQAAQFGALELQHHLKAVTGGDFAIVTAPEKDKPAIFVGDSPYVQKMGFFPSKMREQQYTVSFRKEGIILAGKDTDNTKKVTIRYTGINNANGTNWPGLYARQGTMYAVYDFLHDFCGVSWLDPTDYGTVIRQNPNLKVGGETSVREPFMSYRGAFDHIYSPEEWSRIRQPQEWLKFRKLEYPQAYAHGSHANRLVQMQQQLFLLRMKCGGTYRPANHSFYNYYERFLQKKHPNFEVFKPQYFAQKTGSSSKENEFILSAYDARKEPPQLCYSNPETVEQVIKDIRNYFDNGGYKKKYRNIGRINAGYIWGKDAFCIEPMDNDGFCECARCKAEYEPDRRTDRSEHSTHWFNFVNKVAREIKKSHPDKKITTLAYATHEGLPTGFRLEDNVIVYFCISCNRMPYCMILPKQLDLMKKWRNAYPDQPMAMWLYNTFPNERTALEQGYNCFPGFFGTEAVKQYHLFKELNIRGGIFHCGFIDDFENFLNLRLMCDPSLELKHLKDEYFASYGKAEPDIRAFYDLVEERYCNPKYYKGHNGHQNKYIAWGLLGTQDVMAKLAQYMKQAEVHADTPQAKARVALWKAGIWEYMLNGKQNLTFLKNETKGVRVVRTEYNGGVPENFGQSILQGKPFKIWAKGCVLQKGAVQQKLNQEFLCFTDGRFESKGVVNGDAQRMLLYSEMPVGKLKHLRVTIRRGNRTFARFTPVILKDGVWQAFCGHVLQEHGVNWKNDCQDGMGYITLDLYFEDGVFPEKADGLGILDDSRYENWFFPEYVQIEAN